MIYKIFRVLMRMALKFYFKKIEISGLKNIPEDVPVIFACNHPSAFMEAVLLACFQPRILHFLVRGDVFEIGWLKGLLRITNQIPIYRFKDGFSNLKQNKNTFSKANKILHEGGAIIIYPEGSTILTKELRSLKKGVSRLALSTLEAHDSKELYIVPVGINYFNVLNWRSDVSIQIGQAIDATQYKSQYQEKPPEALQILTKRIYDGLKPLVVSVPDYRPHHDWFLAKAIQNAREAGDNRSIFEPQMQMAVRLNESNKSQCPEVVLSHPDYRRSASSLQKWSATLGIIILGILAIPSAILFVPIWLFAHNLLTRKRLDVEFLAPSKLSIFLILTTALVLIFGVPLFLISPLIGALWVPGILVSFWALSVFKDCLDFLNGSDAVRDFNFEKL